MSGEVGAPSPMRILLIAAGRCGSSALARALAAQCDLTFLDEPLIPDRRKPGCPDAFFVQNILTAPLPPRIVLKDIAVLGPENAASVGFYIKLAERFDHVVLMNRRDTQAHVTSILHAHQYGTWTDKYTPQPLGPLAMHREHLAYFARVQQVLAALAEQTDWPTLWYEDVFVADPSACSATVQQAGLPITWDAATFAAHLHPSGRYRRG